MTNQELPLSSSAGWRVAVESVRGAAHRRKGQANQDAVACRPASRISPWSIAAVADGHGSPACLRSRTGARLAVRCAIEALHSLAVASRYSPRPGDGFLQPHWTRALVRQWQIAVTGHLHRCPVPLRSDAGETEPPLVLYGTTLLAALACPQMLFFLQIGDGDILTVWPEGEIRTVWPPEPAIGEETASLCLPNAEQWVRTSILPVTADSPEMILLATDGYAKSFASRQDFLQVGSDLRDCIGSDGWRSMLRQLPFWLRETTEAGSGDDISVGILSRI